ncbi:hypothetical protein ACFQ1I_22015 [Kitasatospora arboriphila]
MLEPGTCLSVPRGTAHRVTGTGELTVHLTVGYEPFADAAAEARRLCTAGTGLPAADRTRLAGRLARRTERRHGVSLPGALTGELRDDARIRWASRFPPTVEHARDGLVITTMDRRFRLDGRLARTVGLLTAGAPLSWSQLCERSDLPAADVRSLVGFGIRHDFLICEG